LTVKLFTEIILSSLYTIRYGTRV